MPKHFNKYILYLGYLKELVISFSHLKFMKKPTVLILKKTYLQIFNYFVASVKESKSFLN